MGTNSELSHGYKSCSFHHSNIGSSISDILLTVFRRQIWETCGFSSTRPHTDIDYIRTHYKRIPTHAHTPRSLILCASRVSASRPTRRGAWRASLAVCRARTIRHACGRVVVENPEFRIKSSKSTVQIQEFRVRI
jgi:hypothetical protein